jgi:type VI secretion system secreted protein Hcp
VAHGDMLLQLAGVQGESFDAEHKDHIDIEAWSWGMVSPTNVSTGQPYAKVQVSDFKIVKRADRSSPVLIQYLKENVVVKTGKLFVRKAGGAEALSYYEIAFKNIRITSFNASFDNHDGSPKLTPILKETVTLAFETATFSYTPQSKTGAKGGGVVEYTVNAYPENK